MGCRDIGGELARRLLADGHEVYGLLRRFHLLPAGVRPITADLQDPDSLQAVPGGLDAVCYAAATDGRSPEAYRGAYGVRLQGFLSEVRRLRGSTGPGRLATGGARSHHEHTRTAAGPASGTADE